MTKQPKIIINSRGPQGNIFYILAVVSRALRKESRIIEFNDLRDQVLESNSYEEAIAIIREHVELVDLDGLI